MNKDLTDLIPTLPFIENIEDINESTRLYEDLNLYGLTARRFFYLIVISLV